MKRIAGAIVILLIAVQAQAAESPAAIYHSDPAHLWNRLYRAVAMRGEAGVLYGEDIAEPYWESFDDNGALVAVLDEFLKANGQDQVRGELPRALLLSDVWAAFDLAATGKDERLQRRLAQVIGRLALPAAAIEKLPNNYAQAVKSGRFAADFDPAQPERVFLPPDLLDPQGQWIQIGEAEMGGIAPMHLRAMGGRSAFMVLLHCPGGRAATLAYLEKLNRFDMPWLHEAAEMGERYEGDGSRVPVRGSALRINPATPQPPEGTIVALVRQMAVINDRLEPAITPVIQKVQFRVLRRIEPGAYMTLPERLAETQSVHELVMRRRDLLAGAHGGLRAVTADEKEYRRLLRFMGIPREQILRGPVVLSTCATCHRGNGIFSLNTYRTMNGSAGDEGPKLQPAREHDFQRSEAVRWKQQQFDWGLLRGLLASGQ